MKEKATLEQTRIMTNCQGTLKPIVQPEKFANFQVKKKIFSDKYISPTGLHNCTKTGSS